MTESSYINQNLWKSGLNPIHFLQDFTLNILLKNSFQTQFYRKTVGFSGIQTRIVGVEGEHADHLTTTEALLWIFYITYVKNKEKDAMDVTFNIT